MKKTDSVSDVVESVLQEAGLGRAVELWDIYKVFDSLFDKGISSNMKIVGLRNGTLTVYVPSSVWIQELSFFEGQIINKVNASVGNNAVKRIKFTEV